jgi:RNA polymerase sigma factor (sigma-70 family)
MLPVDIRHRHASVPSPLDWLAGLRPRPSGGAMTSSSREPVAADGRAGRGREAAGPSGGGGDAPEARRPGSGQEERARRKGDPSGGTARAAAAAPKTSLRKSRPMRDLSPASDADDVMTYLPALRAFAWTLCRREQDVDDLVQETLTKALARFDRYQKGTNLRAWLFTIMRNTHFTAAHKAARERPGGEDCVSGSVCVDGTQEWSVRGNEVWRAVLALPEHYREMLILVVMLGESYENAARICGVAIGTVKSRVNRARGLVLEQLGETAL